MKVTEEKKFKLDQVSVRLKLFEDTPLYSTQEITSPRRAVEVMKNMMMELDREYIAIVNLDNGGRPINFNIAAQGTLNSCQITMRELLKSAILANSAKFLLLHNHPGYRIEKPKPSREDDITTLRVMLAGEFMGIPLMDHVIVAGGTGACYSYKTEYGDKFNITDFGKCIGADGIEGVFKEPVQEYNGKAPEKKEEIGDPGPKRVEKTSGKRVNPEERPSVREMMRSRKKEKDAEEQNAPDISDIFRSFSEKIGL